MVFKLLQYLSPMKQSSPTSPRTPESCKTTKYSPIPTWDWQTEPDPEFQDTTSPPAYDNRCYACGVERKSSSKNKPLFENHNLSPSPSAKSLAPPPTYSLLSSSPSRRGTDTERIIQVLDESNFFSPSCDSISCRLCHETKPPLCFPVCRISAVNNPHPDVCFDCLGAELESASRGYMFCSVCREQPPLGTPKRAVRRGRDTGLGVMM